MNDSQKEDYMTAMVLQYAWRFHVVGNLCDVLAHTQTHTHTHTLCMDAYLFINQIYQKIEGQQNHNKSREKQT